MKLYKLRYNKGPSWVWDFLIEENLVVENEGEHRLRSMEAELLSIFYSQGPSPQDIEE